MSPLFRSRLSRCTLVCGIVLSMCLAAAPGVHANVRLPSGDMPLYAQLACPDCVQHNEEWAVIPFFRPPACVPPDFNLLNYFDSAAFACTPPTTEGFEIWKHGPGIDPVPLVWQLKGLGAVPVYFVRWPELQTAMADGELKIGELEGLPSLLRGVVDSYKQTARNEGMLSIVVLQMIARGVLEDGRTFDVESVSHGPDLRQNTRISFR